FERVLDIEPSAMDALRGIERICRQTEDWARLLGVLDKQIDAASDDEDRIGALMRLADLHERQFVKPGNAAPKFELVLLFDALHDGAHEGLERCYAAMRAWPELVQALERRARLSVNPLEKTDCLMKVAGVLED